MNTLYNTILQAYVDGFETLEFGSQFHFASRLYLWSQVPHAVTWAASLRPQFTANEQPASAIRELLAQPASQLRETAAKRQPYLDKYPNLQPYKRTLFRLLFLHTVYDIDTRHLFYELFPANEVQELRQTLLADDEGLAALSSSAVNFLYLLDRFIEQDEISLPIEHLIAVGQQQFKQQDDITRQLHCYFYTHCIIAESLFYFRPIPTASRDYYINMLTAAETLIDKHFDTVKLDNKLEFLVCCRLLSHQSPLEGKIITSATQALGDQGFITESRNGQPPTLANSEHRNVLFLMSQLEFQPLTR